MAVGCANGFRRTDVSTIAGFAGGSIAGFLCLSLAIPPFAIAEGPRTGGARIGPQETRPELPELLPQPAPELELPPVPPPREQRPATGARVFVREYRFTGNTVLSDDELAAVLEPIPGATSPQKSS
jgi:hypothetical protein